MVESKIGNITYETPSRGIIVTLDKIVEKYGQGPKKDQPEIAIELALEYTFLRFNHAMSKGTHDEADMWKEALEKVTKEGSWTLLKSSVSNFDLMLDSENGDGKREEYSIALQNLVDSFE